MPNIGTEVARQQDKRVQRTVTGDLANAAIVKEIQRAVPAGMSGDRVARIALTLVRKSDLALQQGAKHSLSQCSPESFVAALMTSSAMGLEVGVNDEAYLVPYRQECTLIVGYHGMLKLAWQHPLMHNIGSGFVWPEDEFDYDAGMDPFVKHKPARRVQRPEDAWPDLFYSWATLTTGGRAVNVLTREEVKALRGGKEGVDARFKGGDPMHWMSRKTSVRQLLKPLPKSVAAHWAHKVDEQPGSKLFVEQVPQQIAAQIDRPTEPAAIEQATEPEVDGPMFSQPANAQGSDPWEQS